MFKGIVKEKTAVVSGDRACTCVYHLAYYLWLQITSSIEIYHCLPKSKASCQEELHGFFCLASFPVNGLTYSVSDDLQVCFLQPQCSDHRCVFCTPRSCSVPDEAMMFAEGRGLNAEIFKGKAEFSGSECRAKWIDGKSIFDLKSVTTLVTVRLWLAAAVLWAEYISIPKCSQ